MGLSSDRRLRRSSDFYKVLTKGRRAANGILLMAAVESDRDSNRYGLAVSKRVGGAVVRNRLKRRLRELLRGLDAAVIGGQWDVVVTARPAAAGVSYQELGGSLERLGRRLGLMSTEGLRRVAVRFDEH